jgi:hypothetical protein
MTLKSLADAADIHDHVIGSVDPSTQQRRSHRVHPERVAAGQGPASLRAGARFCVITPEPAAATTK